MAGQPDVSAELLSQLGQTWAAELGKARAEHLLAADAHPRYAGEWQHGNVMAPTALLRVPLADGLATPDVDGFVAYVGPRGITRAELPGLIGFLTAVLAAQDIEDGAL